MRLPNSLKRASVTGALFCYSLLLPAYAEAASTPCLAERSDETVEIQHIHDGDTVWLRDGRKIRLIGINTPELARDDRPADPLAGEAKAALQQRIRQSAKVRLRYGQEKSDRYGRLLAHLYDSQGQNLSEWLLRQGLAYALTVPPNLHHNTCYRQAEQDARAQRKGLWSDKYTYILQADKLPRSTRGFQLIQGQVERVGHSRDAVWLNFNRQFAVRIQRQDLPWFQGIKLDNLKGKRLEVRGWVQYHNNQLRMRVQHPAALQDLP